MLLLLATARSRAIRHAAMPTGGGAVGTAASVRVRVGVGRCDHSNNVRHTEAAVLTREALCKGLVVKHGVRRRRAARDRLEAWRRLVVEVRSIAPDTHR